MTETNDRFLPALPLAQVIVSKTNPRTHFDPDYIAQLAESISEKGVLEPIIVRPLKALVPSEDVFEIVAGECRYRASVSLDLTSIPAIVRDYSDEDVLEIQLIENVQRNDLRPLECARGFRRLIDTNPTKHSAESIARKIGLSPSWVWDVMKLLDLIAEAQQLLDDERITLGHAIPLARLKAEDQKRAISRDNGGLFEDEDSRLPEFVDPNEKPSKYDGYKVRSIREFTSWITRNIRHDVAHMAKAAPLEFEAAAAQVEERQARPGRGKKLVPITFEHYCPDGAKGEERTYGSTAWKRADGQEKSKPCEFAVLGVVVAGEDGYGQQFDVCIARDKCQVHWGKEIAEREKTQKLRASGKTSEADKRDAAQRAKAEREERERDQKRARWQHFKPALEKACAKAIGGLKTKLPPAIFAAVLKAYGLPAKTTVDGLAKSLLITAAGEAFDRAYGYYDEPQLLHWAKVLGVDVKACEPKKPEPEEKVLRGGKLKKQAGQRHVDALRASVQTSGAKAKKSAKGKKAA